MQVIRAPHPSQEMEQITLEDILFLKCDRKESRQSSNPACRSIVSESKVKLTSRVTAPRFSCQFQVSETAMSICGASPLLVACKADSISSRAALEAGMVRHYPPILPHSHQTTTGTGPWSSLICVMLIAETYKINGGEFSFFFYKLFIYFFLCSSYVAPVGLMEALDGRPPPVSSAA